MKSNRPSKLMIKRAMAVVTVMVVLGFGTGVVRLAKLQLVDGETYRQKAELQQLGDSSVQALRGTIYDCNMRVLAQSATAWKVFVDPAHVEVETKGKTDEQVKADLTAKRSMISSGLSEILDVDEEKIEKMLLKTSSGYQKVKGELELDVKNAVSTFISENKLFDCVGIEPDTKRYYPFGSLASTIIGFTGTDDVGIEGLENKYDTALTGIPGRVITAKNGTLGSMPIEYTASYESQQGKSLVLTVDETIQSLLETELAKAYESAQANAAYGIVMDVKTGAILAMSNQPDYDLNDPYKVFSRTVSEKIDMVTDQKEKNQMISVARQAQWRNRTISDTYEPGSVFKVITLAAGLEEGVVTDNTSYNCGGGIQVANNYIRCHKRTGHGPQNLQQGLMNSCNPFFITVGQKIGVEKFCEYFEAFGFTDGTGIDLSGEAIPKAGVTYHSIDTMGIPQLSSAAFGQTFQISPIQMITAISAIANGGKLMQPYIVAREIDGDGNIVSQTQPKVKRQVVSEQTARRVLDMMEAVVSSGTGKNAYVAGYHVAGKTGTSQKIGAGNGKYVSSFTCIAPGDDPQIAILITIDEPIGQINGGQIAAPVAATLVEEVMAYLGVDPKYNEKEQSAVDIASPALTGRTVAEAKKIASENDFQVRVIGKGEDVVKQIPAHGQNMPQKGVVILYTDSREEETTVVPDFAGMSLKNARQSANVLGLNLKISGNAFMGADILAYSQDIPKDTEVKYGSIVTVYFKSYSGLSDSIYG